MKSLADINWRVLLESRRYLLFSVVCVILAGGLIIWAIIPQAQMAFDLFDQRTSEERKLQLLRTKAQQLEAMNNSPLLGQIETVNLVLPSRKPLLELMGSLSQSSREANVTITKLELSPGKISTGSAEPTPSSTSRTRNRKAPTKSKPGVETLEVEIEVEGQLDQLNTFFQQLENRSPLSTLTDISLSQKVQVIGEIEDTDVFEASVIISTSFFTQSVASAVEAALPNLGQQQQQILDDLNNFQITTNQTGTEIEGGGLNDLFGVSSPEFEAAGQAQIQDQSNQDQTETDSQLNPILDTSSQENEPIIEEL